MFSRIRNKAWAAAFLVLALCLAAGAVWAHGDTETEDHKVVVGFLVEPAYEGLPNGVELRVTKPVDDGNETTMQHDAGKAGQGHDDGGGHGQTKAGVDTEGHGAIFGSDGISTGETFSYKIDPMLGDMTIPYHNHANHDVTGSITVDHHADMSGTVEIEIRDSMYMPADVKVQAGTTLVWINRTSSFQMVTSGPPPSGDHADQKFGEDDVHRNQPGSIETTTEAPVEGLEQTLQVEITHVPTGVSRVLDLRPVFGRPGDYTADLIPTAQGVYEIRVFGAIEGTEFDETFVSRGGGGEFSDVLPATALHFPEPMVSNRELEGATRGALDTARQAQDTALAAQQTAEASMESSGPDTLAILGIILGAAGLASGTVGMVMAIRKR